MLSFFLKRIGFTLIGLLVTSILVFSISEVLPGDVAQVILGPTATPESLKKVRALLELDKPAYVRYLNWLNGVVHGDFGMSLTMPGVSINSLIARRLMNSLILAILATFFVVPLSLTFGTLAALSKKRFLDHLINILSLSGISTPVFVSGVLLMYFFSILWPIFPASSVLDPSRGILRQLPSIVLPMLSLSFVMLGYVTRMTRASVIEVLDSDYVRTAVLKGLPRRYIIFKHVLRNSLLPSITVIAMNFGWVLGGAVIAESIFSFPGIGRLIYSSVKERDIPIIQAAILLATAGYFILNLCADLLYGILDPRIKYGQSEE